ncbi:MAG: PQQ-binding-like beta-propeller repeat protein [Candidatus Hydrogenedentes bacterium]|nr:PQQ-binding-like beta-propeller repeat protein [Candidatus Hydrogenedentota bacterium]
MRFRSLNDRLGGLLIAAAILFSDLGSATAEDWAQWRGRDRLGLWEETGILSEFPEGGLEFVWRVPIGEGYAGPAVAGGRVFLPDFIRSDNPRLGQERVVAYDEQTGRVLWTHAWEIDNKGLSLPYANGPRATPTVDGERVYVLGSKGRLLCLKVADGTVIWSHDYLEDYDAELPQWGMTSAPLVDGEKLICLVGGKPDAMVMAFDKKTGAELWRSLPTENKPGYSPPIIVEAGGVRQLIVWHPTLLASLNPETGEVYWTQSCDIGLGQSIINPVFHDNQVLVSSDKGGSIMMQLDTDTPTARLLWRRERRATLDTFMSTPFIVGDFIYGNSGRGDLMCVERMTGKEVWRTFEATEDVRISTAFLVKNGDRYFITNDRGDLIIARLTPEGYQEIDRTHLIEPTNSEGYTSRGLGAVVWSQPAYANAHILARNDKELVRASLKKKL